MKTLSTIPTVPGAVPVLGHGRALGQDPMAFLGSLAAYPDLVQIRLGPHPVVIICNPELTDEMLRDTKSFDKGGPLVDMVAPLVGEGLATCPMAKHKPARKLLQPIFSREVASVHADRFPGAINKVVDGWRDGQVMDMPVEARRITIQVAVDTLFAGVFDEDTVDQMADDLTAWQVGVAQRMSRPPVLDLLPTPTNIRFRAATKRVRRTVDEAIVRHKASGNDQLGVLSSLLSPEGEEIPWFDSTTLIDHAMTFLIAPTATISSVLCWLWHELSRREDLQNRLNDEVDAVLGEKIPTAADIPKLELTKRLVAESLRMYPSLYFAPLRTVVKDIQLGGYDLPVGTVVAYSPYIVHRRPELYADPSRFDPDRWADTSLPLPSRNAFIPFGHGVRQCIAGEFSFNEMVLAVATVASKWRLESVAGTPLQTRSSVNLTPRGLRLKPVRRVPIRAGAEVAGAARGGRRRPTRSRKWLI
ncbi:cytochrome P450 [Lentzea sp.]|uniref:cytochrome P450 n=1 Tax=Lentzea sp. TaxID=56099 RepID=UPI002C27D60D|nr:cytochrome P450 [Lentzea sp.]HUQ56219.1 cytochrome P450 [Lentzea sp.]